MSKKRFPKWTLGIRGKEIPKVDFGNQGGGSGLWESGKAPSHTPPGLWESGKN